MTTRGEAQSTPPSRPGPGSGGTLPPCKDSSRPETLAQNCIAPRSNVFTTSQQTAPNDLPAANPVARVATAEFGLDSPSESTLPWAHLTGSLLTVEQLFPRYLSTNARIRSARPVMFVRFSRIYSRQTPRQTFTQFSRPRQFNSQFGTESHSGSREEDLHESPNIYPPLVSLAVMTVCTTMLHANVFSGSLAVAGLSLSQRGGRNLKAATMITADDTVTTDIGWKG
jgi:hypothetical protein